MGLRSTGSGTWEAFEWVEDGNVWVGVFWFIVIVCVLKSCTG